MNRFQFMELFSGWLLFVFAGVFAVFLLRARFLPRPFFGGLFALALTPFICCACISYARLREVISFADSVGCFDPDNLIQRLHEAGAPFYFGAGTSAVLLFIHLVLCLFTRHGLTTRSSEQRLAVEPIP